MEQRSGKNKKGNNKMLGCLAVIILVISFSIIVSSILGSKNDNSNKDSTVSKSSSSGDWSTDVNKGEFLLIAEKYIKETYAIDNFKIDHSSKKLKVYNSPKEINAETGEEYSNITNGGSEFTYQDKIYSFSLMYNKIDENKYSVIYLHSNYDSSKGIDVPFKSAQ